ncbi:hypothetical protein [Lentilactobacillus kisonensis]|uniref:Uncharacterized protein n=2 Tax=Lentilactobacillus kisonensis TaxID=481722 RepID=H1LHT1_9LACO|nr:hypothetical protein [Lentilactobacillus kisonensis]EHO50215.1 hypothetical protein HMPREF9104_02172 [Lentilactobacillus kisonensis F0435]KRL20815.1 hypothetical protein FC98_GL001220 [Lentilactobacillus kisonensis DSM 19906 = JCM 15041]
MIVAWKYSLLNNIPEFLIFVLVVIQELISISSHTMTILLFAIGLLWVIYSLAFRRWFQRHPEYDPANRHLTKLGYAILGFGLIAAALLFFGSQLAAYLPTILVLIATFFLKDVFTTTKSAQGHQGGR